MNKYYSVPRNLTKTIKHEFVSGSSLESVFGFSDISESDTVYFSIGKDDEINGWCHSGACHSCDQLESCKHLKFSVPYICGVTNHKLGRFYA